METLNVSQLVKRPTTRVTDRSATLIDHVFLNIDSTISEINVPCWSISDHYPVTITRKCKHVNNSVTTSSLIGPC